MSSSSAESLRGGGARPGWRQRHTKLRPDRYFEERSFWGEEPMLYLLRTKRGGGMYYFRVHKDRPDEYDRHSKGIIDTQALTDIISGGAWVEVTDLQVGRGL